MDEDSTILIHKIARNYLLYLVDFPLHLKPEHLNVPVGEQNSLFAGLLSLHQLIKNIYDYFSQLISIDKHWADSEYCYKSIESPVKLLWALGTTGQLIQGVEGSELKSCRVNLEQAIKKSRVKDPVRAFEVLKAVGIDLSYFDTDGLPCPGGYAKCTSVMVRYLPQNDPFLRAMIYYAGHLPEKKSGRKEQGVIIEVLLRADFRPLLPDYTFHVPHLPATEEEVTRTFADSLTLEIWNALKQYMADHYPQYQIYFRVPAPGKCRWVADYSNRDDDYGLWSIFIDEGGLYVRIVLIDGTINNMLGHVDELSPQFQEYYLNAVRCKDCSHCGKHVFYTHQDHIHRLCKSPWFISPYLHREDLPDIERLIDFRLAIAT